MGAILLPIANWLHERVLAMNHEAEALYCRSDTMASLLNQITFFMLCDRWFCPHDKLTSLYSLMFYNVAGYLILYARHLMEGLSPVVHVSEHTNIRHLAMTATKVVLQLTKIVSYAITGVFLGLVFGLEQGLEHFNPSWCYILITAPYYIITERGFQQKWPVLLNWLECEWFENLEVFWSPVLLRIISSALSLFMIVLVWLAASLEQGGWLVIMAASYVNVFLTLRDMDRHLKVLYRERSSLNKYRLATQQELSQRDDVCAVCLQPMRFARITPCNHIFHGDCLRRCLKDKPVCPLCKYQL